jgi:hypothetical protein
MIIPRFAGYRLVLPPEIEPGSSGPQPDALPAELIPQECMFVKATAAQFLAATGRQ